MSGSRKLDVTVALLGTMQVRRSAVAVLEQRLLLGVQVVVSHGALAVVGWYLILIQLLERVDDVWVGSFVA